MSALAFFDTNILVYTDDALSPEKHARAIELFNDHQARGTAVISLQVLQEYYNTLTRKLGFAPADAAAELRVLMALDTVIITPDLILAATALHASASLSFWDSLIIAAAQAHQCTELWSEDLQDGRKFATLEIVNPLARR